MTVLTAERESWRLRQRFAISRGSRTEVEVVVAYAEAGGVRGRGECTPYARYGETPEGVAREIRELGAGADDGGGAGGGPEGGLRREQLASRMPAGSARNAVDAALWDLEAKTSGRRAWETAGLAAPLEPLVTCFTLGLGSPEEMAEGARAARSLPLLKLKLGAEGDVERVRAVRDAAPDPRLVVDANEGWSTRTLQELAGPLAELGVEMIEQPLPAGDDDALRELDLPVPLCADESCHDRSTLPGLEEKYDVVNLKLDKTGGLTEALATAKAAEARGLDLMVGCMLGTSLAMAPAILLAQRARWTDLDGPQLLARDRTHGLLYERGRVFPPDVDLWG